MGSSRGSPPQSKLSRRACTCEYGLQSCRGESAGVAKRLLAHRTIRNFSHRGATGDVGEVLDFGGLSSVDRWVAACKGDTQEKVRIVTWDFGLGIGHGAVSRRPPISLDTMVPRTEGYTYDAGVWGLYIVQGPFSDAPCLSK
jgi:hypothetical protein